MKILVLAEQRQGKIRDITFEMINLAKKITEDIYVLIPGEGDISLLKPVCKKIIKVNDPLFQQYLPEPYIKAIDSAIKVVSPDIIMIGHTSSGMDLAPSLSLTTSIPLITDCIDAKFEDKRLYVLRQIYGGKIYSELLLKPYERYILTIRPATFDPIYDLGMSADIMEIQVAAGASKRRFLEYIEEKIEDIDISSADILVSIGRGIGKPENIPIVQRFADQIGAMLSCSRPVADKGWLPKSRQVGSSGKIVSPKIYIALGISGAFQHQVGMKNSKLIIAVNKDPKAPIFKIAHYGVVADMFQVLPILEEKLKQNA